MFVEAKKDGEAQKPVIGREDFIAWLRTKDPNEAYNFYDCNGACAVGQYMAARGIPWNFKVYNRIYRAFPRVRGLRGIAPCNGEQTFGALLRRMTTA